MPRGADYADEPPHSDNAVPETHNLTHGSGGNTTADAPLGKEQKTAPMPEGLSEVHDHVMSGGGSGVAPGTIEGSGKGGHEPKTLGEEKGLGGRVPTSEAK